MQGFKSFAKRTEIPLDVAINVFIGPNGAGKSNVSDAICFVLGRLSAKSMRAEKSSHLIFMGSKYVKPAHEAMVELVFDNTDRTFAIDRNEVVLTRIVRRNGQGIYKINGDTKTRNELIETLAQAGIDPYGFNIILQGQIQSIVRIHPEERRKIIEEVAGISVYESRKEKSLKELEKTDARLKEIGTILRERTAYLNNLERERAQAQRYQELQLMSKRLRASLIRKKLDEKKKDVASIMRAIEEKIELRDKKHASVVRMQESTDLLSEKIQQINRHIQQATGLEQSRLREDLTNLRAELEGQRVRKEGYENRKAEVQRRIAEMKKSVPELEREILALREQSPLMAKKSKELRKKKGELAFLEEERKKLLTLKTGLQAVRERISDKQRQLARVRSESESLIKYVEELSVQLVYHHEQECRAALASFQKQLHEHYQEVEELYTKELEHERVISVARADLERYENIKKNVSKLEVCPLCQSKISEQHVQHVFHDCDQHIEKARSRFEGAQNALGQIRDRRTYVRRELGELEKKKYGCEKELIVHSSIHDKKSQLKKSVDYEHVLKQEIQDLEQKMRGLEQKTLEHGTLESEYESKMLEIEEISSRTAEDVGTTLLYKERELEKMRSIIEGGNDDLVEIEAQISDLGAGISEKESRLEDLEEKLEALNKRFTTMFSERDTMQQQIQEMSAKLSSMQNEVRQVEDQINYLKIGKAKLEGERETIEIDMNEYLDVELVSGSVAHLEERLTHTHELLEKIGSINLRALDVYDMVKKEYGAVKERVDTLDREKVEILKIIEEIDKRKYRTFMKTFKSINELFTRNFAQLSRGTAYLEIENTEDIFAGGMTIAVKIAKGKYFDVSSLSGGEQTLVALSLLFAIQEYRPYQFYILDEIDAALDKRNSERLAVLLNRYMKLGQYIIVTHNDAVILNSQILYGVSMHEGVSKVLSLKVS